MRLVISFVASAICMTACSRAAEQPADAASPETHAIAEANAKATNPPTPTPDKSSLPNYGTAPSDACGAAERQGWVSQPRSEVPATPARANWRVYETGDMLTQDLRSDRLNVEINPTTGQVVRVYCG